MSTVGEPVELPLTYEEYLAEGELNRRYDIVDGVRHIMTTLCHPRTRYPG